MKFIAPVWPSQCISWIHSTCSTRLLRIILQCVFSVHTSKGSDILQQGFGHFGVQTESVMFMCMHLYTVKNNILVSILCHSSVISIGMRSVLGWIGRLLHRSGLVVLLLFISILGLFLSFFLPSLTNQYLQIFEVTSGDFAKVIKHWKINIIL